MRSEQDDDGLDDLRLTIEELALGEDVTWLEVTPRHYNTMGWDVHRQRERETLIFTTVVVSVLSFLLGALVARV